MRLARSVRRLLARHARATRADWSDHMRGWYYRAPGLGGLWYSAPIDAYASAEDLLASRLGVATGMTALASGMVLISDSRRRHSDLRYAWPCEIVRHEHGPAGPGSIIPAIPPYDRRALIFCGVLPSYSAYLRGIQRQPGAGSVTAVIHARYILEMVLSAAVAEARLDLTRLDDPALIRAAEDRCHQLVVGRITAHDRLAALTNAPSDERLRSLVAAAVGASDLYGFGDLAAEELGRIACAYYISEKRVKLIANAGGRVIM